MWNLSEAVTTKIERAISSRYPIVYLVSWEEERIEHALRDIAKSHYRDDRSVVMWTAARGFHTNGGALKEIKDPLEALQFVASASQDHIYLMKDFPAYFEESKDVVRALRDLYDQLAERDTYIMLMHPLAKIPEDLKKEVFLIEVNLPNDEEIFNYLSSVTEETKLPDTLDEDWLYKCAAAMRGLALNEVRHLFFRLIGEKKFELDEVLPEIYDEKAQVLLKESCLRVVPQRSTMDQIGGLENLKKWVIARGKLFSKEAHDAGIPMPSGVLFMGVSGCGKSLAAKTISTAWELQLVRLDMNLVLSGAYGTPEFAFDRAIRVAESIAPVVLWIDEIENAFGYDEGPSTGGNVNIFSSFLTWMQEKPTSVFVAATANRIQKLPAEMIRKGRFDQVFFLDLPIDKEREEIIRIHIELNGGNVDRFDMAYLAAMTQGWTGAEIEGLVKAARVDAFSRNREFNERDISNAASRIVPLSKTMHEQVKHLRDWSYDRATPASKREKGVGFK